MSWLTQVEVTLARLQFFLLTDVLSYSLLVQAHRTHAVPLRPEVQPCHPPLTQQFSVDADRTLPFQETDRVRDAVLRRDAQTQVDVVRLVISLDQLYSSLLTQLSQDSPHAPAQPSIQHLPPILRDDHNVVLAFPSHMRQAFPFVHAGSPFGGPTGSSRRGNLASLAGSLEALRVTPPEAADLVAD